MKGIDETAIELVKRFGLTPDLYVPIAAKSKNAIFKYIGTLTQLSVNPFNAFVVTPYSSPPPNLKLPIWNVKGVELLHSVKQVWVHVDYTNYRNAYKKAFPNQDIKNYVIDHVMNRRLARLKGFDYLRIVPISRSANSNSGSITEKYGFAYHNTEYIKMINCQNPTFIQYCDVADIVKMLNIKTGNKFQDGINDVLHYFYEVI